MSGARLDASSILTILMASLRSPEPRILLRYTPLASRCTTLTQKIFAINGNVATRSGLEPLISTVTVSRINQLSQRAIRMEVLSLTLLWYRFLSKR